MSRAGPPELLAVSNAILETLAIDPMLAAEMIYRSSPDVWEEIKEKAIAFVGRWHVSGKVDRAVHFMITTGRGEFAAQVWPLISVAANQAGLYRSRRRFPPSVLGSDVDERIGHLPEDLREQILHTIAMDGGLHGIELAARLAKSDASPKVKFAVIEALQFRRADQFVAEILCTAPDEVWSQLARRGTWVRYLTPLRMTDSPASGGNTSRVKRIP